jgi:hypothetical protein
VYDAETGDAKTLKKTCGKYLVRENNSVLDFRKLSTSETLISVAGAKHPATLGMPFSVVVSANGV